MIYSISQHSTVFLSACQLTGVFSRGERPSEHFIFSPDRWLSSFQVGGQMRYDQYNRLAPLCAVTNRCSFPFKVRDRQSIGLLFPSLGSCKTKDPICRVPTLTGTLARPFLLTNWRLAYTCNTNKAVIWTCFYAGDIQVASLSYVGYLLCRICDISNVLVFKDVQTSLVKIMRSNINEKLGVYIHGSPGCRSSIRFSHNSMWKLSLSSQPLLLRLILISSTRL